VISVLAACLVCFSPAAEAGLISNPSFEAVPGTGAGFTGPGLLPSDWEHVVAELDADTYSNDGSYGLSPGAFGNFPGVTAFDGIRWVAGGAFGRQSFETTIGSQAEAFGTTLVTTLTPGESYKLDAHLYQAKRADLDTPGGYHLFLATGKSGAAGAIFLGDLGATTGVDAWEPRSLTFLAPGDSASRPFLIFAPYEVGLGGFTSYPGIDAISFESTSSAVVPEPGSLTILVFGGLLLLAARRRRGGASIS
jgi:hypothetical protein